MFSKKLLGLLGMALLGVIPVYAANSTDSADKDLSADVTVNVAANDTLTWSGTITGAGTLTKTGDGTLIFAHDNAATFSGAIAVQGGAIQLNTAGGFGTGAITVSITPFSGKKRGIILNAADAELSNALTFAGGSITNDSCYTMWCSASAKLNGPITITAGFCLGGDSKATLDLNNTISASSKDVRFVQKGRVNVNEACTITCKTLQTYSTDYTSSSIHFYGDGTRHKVTSCSMKQENVYSEAANSLPYVYYSVTCASASYTTSQRAFDIDLQGHDQALQYLYWNSGTHMSATCGGAYIRSTDAPATLTLKGKESTDPSEAYFAIAENVSLVVDAPKFTQILAIRTHPTAGSITITNGTLQLSNTVSFPNATNLHVYAGATLADKSTVPGSLAGPTNIVIEGTGKISFETTATSPFNARKAVLHISDKSTLEIPSGMTVEIKELWVDGVKQNDGVYTKGSYAFLTKEGTLAVTDYEPTTGIWNAGATPNDDLSTANNWEGGAKPNFSSSFLSVAVSNGTHIAMTEDAYFLGLVFDPSIAGFTFDGVGSLRIAADGVTIPTGDGTAHTWNMACPLVVKDLATWTFPATDTLNITGGMTGSGSTTFAGGTVNIEGTNAVSGGITLNGGAIRVKGVLGSSADAAIFAQVSSLYPITLDGAEIRLACSFSDSSKALYCTAGSSNCILGKIKNNAIYPTVPADATFVIAGEMYIDSASWTPNDAMQGTNIWVAAPYVRGLGTLFRPRNGTTIYAFPTESTYAKEWYLTYGTAHSRFDVDNVCKRRMAYVEASALPAGIARCESESSTCDLNGTTQSFNACTGSKGTIYSEKPAALVIAPLAKADYKQNAANWALYPDSNFGAQLKGPVTLKFAPSGLLTQPTTLTIAARAYETTGSLEVTNGTMIIAANATFKKLAQVTVVDTGVLDVQAATDVFGEDVALEIGGQAQLKVAANTLVRVRTIRVNGVETPIRPKAYTTEQFKEKLGTAFEGSISGDGYIRVMGAGTTIMLK